MTDLAKYRQLADGLSDMIEEGRLTEADIPDDYQWLVEALVSIAGDDPAALEREPDEAMVERVARAIYEEDDVWSAAFPWPTKNPFDADAYRRIARAAIAAMKGTSDE